MKRLKKIDLYKSINEYQLCVYNARDCDSKMIYLSSFFISIPIQWLDKLIINFIPFFHNKHNNSL